MAKQNDGENQNTLLMVLIISVLVLAVGQYLLYRNMQHIKTMIGVTTMELKEGTGVKKDAIFMKGDNVLIREDGIEEVMMKDEKLDDGTIIKKDGTIINPDGSRSKMKNNEEILLDAQ